MIIGYPLAGRLARGIGTARMMSAAGAAFLACFILPAFLPIGDPFRAMVALYFMFGFTGAAEVHLITQAKETFPASHTGRATTLVNVVAIGSSFLPQWLFGVTVEVVAEIAGPAMPDGGALALGYRVAFGLIALLGVGGRAVYAPLAGSSTGDNTR